MTGLPYVILGLLIAADIALAFWVWDVLARERAWARRRAQRRENAHHKAIAAYSPGRVPIFAPIGVVARARRDEAPTRWPLLVWPTGEYPAVAAPWPDYYAEQRS